MIRLLETSRFSEVLTNECTNKHFRTRKLETKSGAVSQKPPPVFFISADTEACETCFSSRFYHRIDTARADFIWDEGSGPSGCLLLLSYEAYLCEEST